MTVPSIKQAIEEFYQGAGQSNCITKVSGASEVLMEARVIYSNQEKVVLGLPKEFIDEYTVYSIETE